MFAASPPAQSWQDLAGWGIYGYVALTVTSLIWILHTKREPTSAIAWCLTVLMMPLLGSFLFILFGYQAVHRPLQRRQRQRKDVYRKSTPAAERAVEDCEADVPPPWDVVARLGRQEDGYPVVGGNAVDVYTAGRPAFDAMLAAIEQATDHVHMCSFIVRADESGRRFVETLAATARRGVEVRFLYDAVGSYALHRRLLHELTDAGGKVSAFLPVLNPFNRLRINLRNHRKVLVVDGKTAFVGGLNVGDEYLGRDPHFGPWRDTHLRVDGPAAGELQRVFLEDWDFAAHEDLDRPRYIRPVSPAGTVPIQVVRTGPDHDYKAIRETYVAGILRARKRVWIASPYFVPDAGLRDALVLAGRSGLDVRFLGLFRPDKWLPFLAARYYWGELLDAGVKVYQYAGGMMHSKFALVDGEWASVGTANFDNRSLYLNFEVNCLIYDAAVVRRLEEQYEVDLGQSVELDPVVFADRPRIARIAENACRLFSPVL